MGLLARFRITPAFVLALVAVVIALRGVAIGSVPNSNGLITACYAKHGGKMRIVNTSAKGKAGSCRHSERKLSWSQKGSPGTPGAPGSPGVAGASGVRNVVVRYLAFSVPANSVSNHLTTECNPGEVALGGGIGWTTSPNPNDAVVYSGPETTTSDAFASQGGTPIGWDGEINNDVASPRDGRLYVICATP
jgi:hypothetical protein